MSHCFRRLTRSDMCVPPSNARRSEPSKPRKLRSRATLPVTTLLILVAATAVLAQSVVEDNSNITAPQVRTPEVVNRPAIGAVMPAPRTSDVSADAERPELSCMAVCSPYTPRLSIAQISFPERLSQSQATLRLDVAATPAALQAGNYGSVPLRAIPEVQIQPGAGIDFERLRPQVRPTYLDKVLDNRIAPRNPVLEPQRLQQFQQLSPAVPDLPADLRAALERDAQTGALEQIRVLAQGVEVRQATPQRSLIVEGMQPGLTYEIRLVRDEPAGAESIAENICRIPVCPADYVNP